MKYIKIIIVFLLLLISLSGCGEKNENTLQNTSTEISRTSLNSTNSETEKPEQKKQEMELEISSFSTPILIKDESRQKNVSIACEDLNGTMVSAGETFSFTNTLGPATPEEGYEKADVFDSEGEIIQEYGGGKCQISSTLYNAVLKTPNLEVVERHEHSRDVNYVPEGQDAAVSYGSVDFKFRNDNDFAIKIYSSTDGEQITTSIFKIYYE